MGVLFGVNFKNMYIVEKILKYNTQHRIFIVLDFYLSNKCVISAYRSFRSEFRVRDGPSRQEIIDLIEKFEQIGSVVDPEQSDRPSIMTKKNADFDWR